MPPLTLEQILARSMRLQPAKASHHLSSAMVSSSTPGPPTTANGNSSSSSNFDPSTSAFRKKEDVVPSKPTLPPSASAMHRRPVTSSTLDDAAYTAHRYLQHSQDREGRPPLASSSSAFPVSSHEERVEGKENNGSSTFPTHPPIRYERGLSSEEEKREDGGSSRRTSSARRRASSPSQEDIIRGLEREAREAKENKYWFMASRERREAEENENSSKRSASSRPTMATAMLFSSSAPTFSSGGASDLVSFLHTAIRLESWEEGIEAVCCGASASPSSLPFALPPSIEKLLHRPVEHATDTVAPEGVLPLSPLPPLPHLPSSSSSPAALSSTKQQQKSVPETLLLQLLSLCEGAGRLLAVEAVGRYYGWRYPLVLTRTVEILLKHTYLPPSYPNFTDVLSYSSSTKVEEEEEKKNIPAPERLDTLTPFQSGTEKKKSWIEAVLDILARSGIPPGSFSVDVFNHILSVCEVRKDCYGALYVIQSMGSNPLQALPTATIVLPPDFRQTIRSKKSDPSVVAKGKESKEVSSLVPPSSSSPLPLQKHIPSTFSWSSPPVSPNVVSYASLIAVLEQAGENQFASYIVSLLPSQEKNDITASYAALIYLWSQQVLTKNRKHKR